MNDDANSFFTRLERLYAALGETIEGDLASFAPDVRITEAGFHVRQDFLGGLTEAQLANMAHAVIYHLAHLEDHAKRAFKADAAHVDNIVSTAPLPLIQGLSNADKHGESRRDGEVSPRLGPIRRPLRMRTTGEAGSFTAIKMTASGPEASGDGTAEVVLTADVFDGNGERVGDLFDLCMQGIAVWEAGLASLDDSST